ncbi:MAG: hypothetical protein M3004_04700 [Bacteroidota bacterium]|nr:hypothetical protein [Bacteroidota bacterium]
MFRKTILIFLFLPLKLLAQDITGVWTGSIYNDTTQKYIPYEITISEEKGKLAGYSHSTFIEDDGKKIIVKSIKLKTKDNKFFVDDEEWVYKNYAEPAPKGVKQHSELSLTTNDSGMILTGPYNTNRTKLYLPSTGTIKLFKKNNYNQTAIIPKLEELNLLKSLSFIPPKEKETFPLAIAEKKTISVDSFKEKDVSVLIPKEEKKLQPSESANKNETVFEPTLPLQQPNTQQKIKEKDVAVSLPMENKKLLFPEPLKQKENIFEPTIPQQGPNTLQKIQEKNIALSLPKEDKKLPSPEPIKPKEIILTQSGTPQKQPDAQQKIKEKGIAISLPKQIKNSDVIIQPKKETTIAIAKSPIKKEEVLIHLPKAKEKEQVSNSPSSIVQKPVPEMISGQYATNISSRKIETIKSVFIKSDSVTITLYDNGEVDGDIVSVLLNGNVIMPNVMLSTNAIKKTIYITPDLGDSLQLIMYAENLGSIPPNTGLLILQDGDDRYEIRFAGDLQKNSAILLRRKTH